MKEVQMTIRIEPELRTSFTQAAEAQHRPAAQVMRELMRAYVEQSRGAVDAPAAASLITAAERSRREKAVNFARASVGLEGFKPSEADEAHSRRFIDGEIDLLTYVQPGLTPAR